jgi:hypothetical protein
MGETSSGNRRGFFVTVLIYYHRPSGIFIALKPPGFHDEAITFIAKNGKFQVSQVKQ